MSSRVPLSALTVSEAPRTTTEAYNEADLVARAQNGSHPAFTQLLERHDRRVMNVILRFTNNQYDSDDLYQEIFIACYKALPKFSGNSSFYTWLYRIALNCCIGFMRKHKPVQELPELPAEAINWERQHKLGAINQAMASLEGPQRISFHLFYIEQWSNSDIANVLDCSEGTVKSHLNRARQKIRQHREVAQWLIND